MVVDGDDWRTQLPPDSRQRIVNKIMETLKNHAAFSGEEELQKLKNIAVGFEEKMFNAASNQSEYLQKISLKMILMDSNNQKAVPNALPSNITGVRGSKDPQGHLSSNNVRPAAEVDGSSSAVASDDWRSHFLSESRQRIINKIMETLKRHVPFSGEEGLEELRMIAVRFEEKIFSVASNQSEYLRKISLKMLTMEANSQKAVPNALPSNVVGACGSRYPQRQSPLEKRQLELQKIADKIEEKMCNEAMSQNDYLQKMNILKDACKEVKISRDNA